MAPFDFKSDKHFVASSDGTTLQVHELTKPSLLLHPSSIRKTHWKVIANINTNHVQDEDDDRDNEFEEEEEEEETSYDGLMFFDGYRKIEGREALTKLAEHLMRLHLMVSPEGYCFQDAKELGDEYVDFGTHYLRLNDLFSWPHHGVGLAATTTKWGRTEMKYCVPRRGKPSTKSTMPDRVVSVEKYEELKKLVKEKDEELEKLREEMEEEMQQLREEKDDELEKLREEMEEASGKKIEELREVIKKKDDELLEVVKRGKNEEKVSRKDKNEKLQKLRRKKDEEMENLRREKDEEAKKAKAKNEVETLRKMSEKEDELQKLRKEKDEEMQEETKKNEKQLEDTKNTMNEELEKLRTKLSSSVAEVVSVKETMEQCRESSWSETFAGKRVKGFWELRRLSDDEKWALHVRQRRAVPPETFRYENSKSPFRMRYSPKISEGQVEFHYESAMLVDDEMCASRSLLPPSVRVETRVEGQFDVNNWWFAKTYHHEGGVTMLAYYDGDRDRIQVSTMITGRPISLPYSKDAEFYADRSFFLASIGNGIRLAFAYRK